jgi:hypothetical protein
VSLVGHRLPVERDATAKLQRLATSLSGLQERAASNPKAAQTQKGHIMRTRIPSVTACVVLIIGAALQAPSAFAAQGNLAGRWTSVDLDGSNQTLMITGTGNPTYAMFLQDDETSGVCDGAPAQLVGPGDVDADRLVMLGTLVCLPGGNPIPGTRIIYSFEHDSAADTLTDFTGVVWHRAG